MDGSNQRRRFNISIGCMGVGLCIRKVFWMSGRMILDGTGDVLCGERVGYLDGREGV